MFPGTRRRMPPAKLPEPLPVTQTCRSDPASSCPIACPESDPIGPEGSADSSPFPDRRERRKRDETIAPCSFQNNRRHACHGRCSRQTVYAGMISEPDYFRTCRIRLFLLQCAIQPINSCIKKGLEYRHPTRRSHDTDTHTTIWGGDTDVFYPDVFRGCAGKDAHRHSESQGSRYQYKR